MRRRSGIPFTNGAKPMMSRANSKREIYERTDTSTGTVIVVGSDSSWLDEERMMAVLALHFGLAVGLINIIR